MSFQPDQQIAMIKINVSRYVTINVTGESIETLFSIDYVNIYLFSIFFPIDFAWWRSERLPHIAYIVIQLLSKLTSHGTLHYLRSADLSKSFSQLIISISIFSQYFFQ